MEWTPRSAEGVAADLMTPLADRWQHVQGVAARVQSLTRDPSCVMAAWLHDIGYAEPLADTEMHAIDGAAHLLRNGAPCEVVSLVAFRTGAEFEAEERGLLDHLLPFDPPDEATLDLLTLADLRTGPTGETVTVEEHLDEILMRYEPPHPVHRAVVKGRGGLEDRCRRALQLV